MPDDEKQNLMDNMEGEISEKSILIEKWWTCSIQFGFVALFGWQYQWLQCSTERKKNLFSHLHLCESI